MNGWEQVTHAAEAARGGSNGVQPDIDGDGSLGGEAALEGSSLLDGELLGNGEVLLSRLGGSAAKAARRTGAEEAVAEGGTSEEKDRLERHGV